MTKPQYSIIVPFYDNRRILELCLTRLLDTLPQATCEIIVVVDNPLHRLTDIVWHRSVRIISLETNVGYSGAVNRGVREARAPTLILMDADIVPQRGWMDALLKLKAQEPRAGVIGAKILSLSRGTVAYFGLAFHEIDVMKPFQNRHPHEAFTCRDRSFQAIPSGVLLIEKKLFLSVGGLDEKLFNAYPDLDLSLTLLEEGWSAWIAADALVYHRGGVSGDVRMAMHSDAKAYFFRKWGTRIYNDALPILELSAHGCLTRLEVRDAPMLAVNFSASLFSHDYMDAVTAGLGVHTVDRYDLPDRARHGTRLQIEERLSWELNRTSVPILYFVDDFTLLEDNYFWFRHRVGRGDVIADRHGNVLGAAEMRVSTATPAGVPRMTDDQQPSVRPLR